MPRTETLRIFLVDDHPAVRGGVRNVLDASPDLSVVGEADCVAGTLASVVDARADVVLVDIRLRDGHGIELCRAVRTWAPEIACLVLTSHSDDEALIEATLAGASGYALKQIRGPDLVDTVRAAGDGVDLVPRAVRRRVVDHLIGVTPDLDDTETELLGMIGLKLTDADIARLLALPVDTVVVHVQELLGRLGIDRRASGSTPEYV